MPKYDIANGTLARRGNPAREGELAARRDNAAVVESAADEVQGVIQICSNRALLYLVVLGGSAKQLGATELASRGLGRHGEWVGFDKAHRIWGVPR